LASRRAGYRGRRRTAQKKITGFIAFAGLRGPAELRTVTRAHVIAWRKDLEKRELATVQYPPEALGLVGPVRLSV